MTEKTIDQEGRTLQDITSVGFVRRQYGKKASFVYMYGGFDPHGPDPHGPHNPCSPRENRCPICWGHTFSLGEAQGQAGSKEAETRLIASGYDAGGFKSDTKSRFQVEGSALVKSDIKVVYIDESAPVPKDAWDNITTRDYTLAELQERVGEIMQQALYGLLLGSGEACAFEGEIPSTSSAEFRQAAEFYSYSPQQDHKKSKPYPQGDWRTQTKGGRRRKLKKG
jgi:hypothetical protein